MPQTAEAPNTVSPIARRPKLMSCLIEQIDVRDRSRKIINPDEVKRLAESMEKIGLLAPIIITSDYYLVAGAHRLAAAKQLGWTEIDVFMMPADADDDDARLWEISENLHRAELTEAERREHIAEWVRLTAEREKEKVSHGGTPAGGEQPTDKAIRKAAKELGIPKSNVSRAVAAESLPQEAKAIADNADLGTVARAKAARASDPVRAVKDAAEARHPSPGSNDQPKSEWHANRATAQRRKFDHLRGTISGSAMAARQINIPPLSLAELKRVHAELSDSIRGFKALQVRIGKMCDAERAKVNPSVKSDPDPVDDGDHDDTQQPEDGWLN